MLLVFSQLPACLDEAILHMEMHYIFLNNNVAATGGPFLHGKECTVI